MVSEVAEEVLRVIGEVERLCAGVEQRREEVGEVLTRLKWVFSGCRGVCRVCGRERWSHDKVGDHEFVGSLEVPVDLDGEVFYEEDYLDEDYDLSVVAGRMEYYLAVRRGRFQLRVKSYRYVEDRLRFEGDWEIEALPLNVAKQLLLKGELKRFLRKLVERLEEENREWEEVAAVARTLSKLLRVAHRVREVVVEDGDERVKMVFRERER